MSSATEFAKTLLSAAQPFPPDRNPVVRRVVDGPVSRAALQPFASMLVTMAEQFPLSICALLGTCRTPRVREALIANLLEEEGVIAAAGQGVRIDREQSHGGLARRFARATGVADENLDSLPLVENAWFMSELRQGRWLAPFAYVSVGFEANVPPTFSLLLDPLRKRWGFEECELAFFIDHVTADERHGTESANLIAALATDDSQRTAALEGAHRGGLAFWHLHRRSVRQGT